MAAELIGQAPAATRLKPTCSGSSKSQALNPTVMVGFNRRFDPSFREVHDRIAAGDIGRLEQLIIVSRDPAPAPREYLATSGGLFRDMTIHDFDLARFFLGEVVEVYATGANVVADYIAELGDIDSAVVVLRGADGALCHITNCRRSVFFAISAGSRCMARWASASS